jgi:uncharacterized beta-barrel protein YwiB (DUF1934 family)
MKSRQQTMDDDEETELVTMGTCEWDGDALVLSYDDTEATGFAGSTTTIRITRESLVTILRTGTVNSNLTLEMGKKHHCLYQTPYGNMMLGVLAKKMSCQLSDLYGEMELEYIIDMNAAFLSDHTIQMRWESEHLDTERMQEWKRETGAETSCCFKERNES